MEVTDNEQDKNSIHIILKRQNDMFVKNRTDKMAFLYSL